MYNIAFQKLDGGSMEGKLHIRLDLTVFHKEEEKGGGLLGVMKVPLCAHC